MEVRFRKCSVLSLYSLLFSLYLLLYVSSAEDTIPSGQSLTFGQTLISKGGLFELGFFNPGNSFNYYIGIWYKEVSIGNRTYVWVANRDAPLDDPTDPTSSELKLLDIGNLVLLNNLKSMIWSTNSTGGTNSSEVVLEDDGNLVLRNIGKPSVVLWQSFDYPTDTVLPGGKLRYDNRSEKSIPLTSWKNPNDPSKGVFSFEMDSEDECYIMKNRTEKYWTSGQWTGQNFRGVPEMRELNINYNYTMNQNETYFTYEEYNTSIISRFMMDLSGNVKYLQWNAGSQQWIVLWSQPRLQCDVYSYCGAYGVCNQNTLPFCRCINGFQPRSESDWNISDFSGGCVRKIALQCRRDNQFLLMSRVRLPDGQRILNNTSASQCKFLCLSNCYCTAYSYNGTTCSAWNQDLLNLQQVSYGDDLYVRLASPSSTGHKNGPKTGIIVGIAGAVLVVGLIVGCVVWKKRRNTKGNDFVNDETRKEDLELPLFDLVTIATATNNFSLSNKIGQGGFGPVYKGVLPTGEEIAIKRLSRDSRQGLQEFMNEVLFIAKLQHRNLVRLLGCCIKGDERMLIYEYMPHKSLDFFIFDKTRSVNLNWQLRFNIIVGIARGLLYLHRDSRLRIIHRDLKASNVLLDNHMNPKIGDFGMARTFGGDQTQENTMRVVGTYGYMSPEYATDGLFSMKSDVFSFGVIVLEIVSGEKNRGFHHEDHDLNLLGHAWKHLNDKNALEIVHASIRDPLTISEMIKCIQVGLLCVQKFPEDRPSMSSVLTMLDGDGAMLPWPKQPGFYTERSPIDKDSLSTNCTKNEVTVTLLEGR